MEAKTVLGIVLTFLLLAMLTSAFNIYQIEATEPPATAWTKTYGGTFSDVFYSVIQTSDGGYALAGTFGPPIGAPVDGWLVKLDSSGNNLWNKTYGGDSYDHARSVVETSDGGYALGGLTSSYGSYDAWLVKTDASGNMQWNQTYGGAYQDYAYSVVQTTDGGYALTGREYSSASNGDDFWLIKTDMNGTVQWSKTYHGGVGGDIAYSVVQTTDGGYALSGVTSPSDAWLVKTDASGNMQWNQTYGGIDTYIGWSLVQTSDGGYAFAGWTNSSGAGGLDFWLVKVDSSGKHQWNKTYGGGDDDWARSVVQTTDGGYALTGRTRSFGAGGHDFWLVKVDSSGKHQWNQTFGGTGAEEAWSLVVTSDSGYALAGSTTSYGAGQSDGWLVKVGQSVGGVYVPIHKLKLLALYIGFTVLLVVCAVTIVYVKKQRDHSS